MYARRDSTTIGGIKKLAVYVALLGGVGAATLGLGTGLAQADATLPRLSGTTSSDTTTPRDSSGDQEVVPRGSVIPVHGDDEHPGAGFHIPGPDISGSRSPGPTATAPAAAGTRPSRGHDGT